MHLSVVHVETFLTVARIGSMTAAASLLSYSLSTVSDHVGQLECRLSCRLFVRTGAGCALTVKGERVALLAERLMDAHQAMCVGDAPVDTAGDQASGAVRRRGPARVAGTRRDE